MFARHVSMKLRANSVAELPRIIENKVLPLLRTQKGFRDEITFVNLARSLVVGISLWDTKEDAEAYDRTTYSNVATALADVVEGTPTVETFEVANSTFHKLASAAKAGG